MSDTIEVRPAVLVAPHENTDASQRYGSGTAAGVGFGNKTNPETSLDDYDNSEHRFGSHTNTDAYSGGHESFGSGATSGAGFGNKTTSNDTSEYDNSDLRTGSHSNTAPYSGGHPHHGSGTVGGAGFGNKTSDGYGTSGMFLHST